jgi:hypothetical protein
LIDKIDESRSAGVDAWVSASISVLVSKIDYLFRIKYFPKPFTLLKSDLTTKT